MTTPRTSKDLAAIQQEVQRGLSAGDLNISESAFERLSQNIARAIARAVADHEQSTHSPQPEFGEEERPS